MADASVRDQTSTQVTLTSHRRMLVWETQAVWDVHAAICLFVAPVAFQSEQKPIKCHRAYLTLPPDCSDTKVVRARAVGETFPHFHNLPPGSRRSRCFS